MDEPNSSSLAQALADVKLGSHLCWFYASEEDHRAVVTAFLSDGFRSGERVVYILDQHPPVTVVGYLWEQGVPVGQYLASGWLTLSSVQGTYMHERVFQPETMIARLRQETDAALAADYQGLRATGEMSWALGNYPGADRLIEYESKLNAFFAAVPCIGLCQYDVRRFTLRLLLEVLRTHPLVIVGRELLHNPYYSPDAPFPNPADANAALGEWLGRLTTPSRN